MVHNDKDRVTGGAGIGSTSRDSNTRRCYSSNGQGTRGH